MSTFYTVKQGCLKLGQLCAVLGLYLSATPHIVNKPAFVGGRAPANYVPNDDMIAVPVDVEMSFYEQHVQNDKNWAEKSVVQQQIRIWQENEIMAQRYGMDTTDNGAYAVPTSREKWEWLQRNYFRYLKRKGEEPLKEESRTMLRSWTSNDEVNSIDEMEAAFRATNKTAVSGRPLPTAIQERQVGNHKKFRFYFQPRIEQGLIIIRTTSRWADARAWIGVNGETEFNVQRTFDATKTRFMMNYYVHSGENLFAIDQHLVGNWSARATSTRVPASAGGADLEDRRFQFNYSSEF